VGPNKCINIWHVTYFGHSYIKEYIWQKPGELYRPIGPLVFYFLLLQNSHFKPNPYKQLFFQPNYTYSFFHYNDLRGLHYFDQSFNIILKFKQIDSSPKKLVLTVGITAATFKQMYFFLFSTPFVPHKF